MAALGELNRRFKGEKIDILRTVTHGISCSIYFHDPENNAGEVYFKTGFVVKQGFGRTIDLETQTDQEILDFSQSFEASEGPFQGAQLPVGGDD
jgi:catechol-2,3-dioxygenase